MRYERRMNSLCSDFPALQDSLAKKEYGTVLGDAEKFWALFCRIVAESPKKNEFFEPCIKERNLYVKGEKDTIRCLKNAIESIRKMVFAAVQEKRSATVLPVKYDTHAYTTVHFREKQTTVDLTNPCSGDAECFYFGGYLQYIEPNLSGTFEAVGLSCKRVSVDQSVATESEGGMKVAYSTQSIRAFVIG